jgi:hypothetical protein
MDLTHVQPLGEPALKISAGFEGIAAFSIAARACTFSEGIIPAGSSVSEQRIDAQVARRHPRQFSTPHNFCN